MAIRRILINMRRRYLKLVIFALISMGLFVWIMQIGTVKKEVEVEVGRPQQEQQQQQHVIKNKAGREYPDFDYKYERVKNRPSVQDIEELVVKPAFKPPKIPTKNETKSIRHQNNNVLINRRSKGGFLNGVELSPNHDQFDVVGGIDLYVKEALSGDVDDEFAQDEAKIVPGAGEGGEPVHLSGAEEEEGQQVMAKEAFNLVASDKISLHRSVPDTRDPRCQRIEYDSDLPTASVIIIFTNEAWTPLLRTIWSVLEKTPAKYLHEIILVDDFSDKKYLKGKLERYIHKKFPSKVRLKRLHQRSGLIRARLTGAELATGDALLFLDSHCECGHDWIQPLLQRIKQEPKAFVVPIIDVIDDKTLEYYHGNGIYFQIGGFTWSGHFNWVDIPEHEEKRRGTPVSPTRTPTMAGGLFAVDRKFFWRIGSYDEEMDVWGGENLEMSFRVWQCGGILETIPCSRVGHIFRSFHPYTFPGNKDTHGINTARTVEVWMDEYKRLFYMNRPDLANIEIGDVSKRTRFKEENRCKSFKWYLDNIFPQKFILDDPDHVFAHGRVVNPASGTCFDTLQNDENGKDEYELGVYPCHEYTAATQFFSYSRHYELRREEHCAEVDLISNEVKQAVRMAQCTAAGNAEQVWTHTKQGRLIHKGTNKCLEAANDQSQSLFAAPCKANTQAQIWYFDHYVD